MESDFDYFTRRASDEMRAAGNASDTNARRIHLEMAARYQCLATRIDDNERHLGLSAVFLRVFRR
jgi:hypothetical protein